jgi:hypothetical protein
VDLLLHHLWYTRDHLFFNAHLFIEFVLHIAEGARQAKSSAHSAVFNETTSSFNALLFSLVVRFVIFTQFDCFATSG